ncbi:MAG: hypothetical protein K0R21_1320 [Anaerocolumna sp.]|jgi:glyoxylase I family protein|nr:hypothetical protein [Anaerocolumna sp.]
MKIVGVHHIAINTRDFQKSICFYRDILKMEFIKEVDLGEDYVAYMKCSDQLLLELFKMNDRLKEQELDDCYVGLKHVAFTVDHLDQWNTYLKEQNVKFALEMTEVKPIQQRVLLIEAPDNVIVELCEAY